MDWNKESIITRTAEVKELTSHSRSLATIEIICYSGFKIIDIVYNSSKHDFSLVFEYEAVFLSAVGNRRDLCGLLQSVKPYIFFRLFRRSFSFTLRVTELTPICTLIVYTMYTKPGDGG